MINSLDDLSVLETYESYGKGAAVLKNKDAMSLLLRLSEEFQISTSLIDEESEHVQLLLKVGFVIADQESIVLSQQGKEFLSLLGIEAEESDVGKLKSAEFKNIFAPQIELSNLPNTELIERCAELPTDHVAWQEFVRRYDGFIRTTVIRTITRRLGEIKTGFEDIVEDIVQNVYLRLLADRCRALRSFRGDTNNAFFAYLRIITISVTHNLSKIKESQIKHSLETELDSVNEPFLALQELISKINEEDIQTFELRETIDKVLDKVLYGKYRKRDKLIFQLCIYEGQTPEEISKLPDIQMSAHAIEVLISRIRSRLIKFLHESDLK